MTEEPERIGPEDRTKKAKTCAECRFFEEGSWTCQESSIVEDPDHTECPLFEER